MSDETLAARIEKIEAQLAIQQLPARYALAVDSRDLDALVGLFVEDVDCGRWGRGRDALQRFYASEHVLRAFYRSVHLICGQTIDLVDLDHASGTVYCRAGHEDKSHWVEMAICYADSYERRDGRWYFARRDEQHWYSTDWQQRPQGPSFQAWPGRFETERYRPKLPQAWPSWQQFWDAAGEEARRDVTDAP